MEARTHNLKRKKLLAACGGIILPSLLPLMAPGVALAQAGLALEEIVVTATRRQESLQDVPMAVSAISGTELTERGLFETSDLNRAAPNLQVSSPYGTQQPNFTIRGVGVGTEYSGNSASPVGVYVDEVYQTFRASHGQQLYDLTQVEILRGPQGTLFGRNTTGGAVNFITRKPELDGVNGHVGAGYGNFARKTVDGALEFTPVDGVFGVRLAGTYVDSDPFVENKLPRGLNTSAAGGASGDNFNSGVDPAGNEDWGARATFRMVPSDTVDLSMKIYASESDGGNVAPIATGASKSSDIVDWAGNPNFALRPVFEAFSDLGMMPGSYSRDANGIGIDEIEVDSLGQALIKTRGAVFNARIDISDDLSFIGIAGYDEGENHISPSADCDGTPLAICNSAYSSDFDAINLDFRLEYRSERLTFTAGAYYGQDTLQQTDHHDFFGFLRDINAALGTPDDYFNPIGFFNGALLSADAPPGIFGADQEYEQYRESWSLYGEGVYALTDTVNVTLGLRHSDDTIEFNDGYSWFLDNAGNRRALSVSSAQGLYWLEDFYDQSGNLVLTADQLNGGAPMPGRLNQSDSSSKLSGRLIVDWQMSGDTMAYASYSRGYRAGTYNGVAYSSPAQVYFVPPEEVDAYELGFKSSLMDSRLELNGAYFFFDYVGQQGKVIDPQLTGNLVSLDGEAQGLELEARFAALSNLHLTASLGWLDSEYDSDECPATPLSGFPPQQGSCIVTVKGDYNVGGNPFPFASDLTFNASFDWDITTIGSGDLKLHGNAAYTGQYYYDAFKDHKDGILPDVSSGEFADGQESYWVYNARLSYVTENYTLALWGRNLTDKEYYPYGISTESILGIGYRVVAPPRTYGLDFQYRF